MRVSFLVTYYNQEQYVRQSMESILAIDKPCEWEILVGDDGSTDGTIQAVEEYVKKYPNHIKLFVMPREDNKKYESLKRVSENRLNLLEHAEGDFFCTLDGDDYYCDTGFIEDSLTAFKNDKNISVVAFGYRNVTNGVEGEDHILPLKKCQGFIDKSLYLKSFYIHAGACVYKKIWGHDRLEYIKNIGYFDDNDILINNLNYGSMYAFNRAIYAYRQTGISIFTSMNEVERAVLNVEGHDVDLKLIQEKYREDLFKRNSKSIITMYIWKNHLKKLFGEDKYERYLTAFNGIQNSIGYKIMIFDQLTSAEKKYLKTKIRKLEKNEIKFTVKTIIKKIIRGL